MQKSKKTPEKKKVIQKQPTPMSSNRRNQSSQPTTIIPMTTVTMKMITTGNNSTFYRYHQFSKCVLVGKLLEITDDKNKFRLTFTDGSGTTQFYVSKFHKHLEDDIAKALDHKKYWKFVLEAKFKENVVDYFCTKLEPVLDHNMISDHIGKVILFNLELSKIYKN